MSPNINCYRLRDMPDEILHHILSFLPTPESVRTSVLSSRWHHLWRCVPAFHFDVGDLLCQDKLFRSEVQAIQAVVASEAVEKINQFIARRDASCSLLRFCLRINTCLSSSSIDPIGKWVSHWISYAGSHGVRNMSVHSVCLSNLPPLSAFFELPSVQTLDLQHIFYSTFNVTSFPVFRQLIAPSKLKALTLHIPCESIIDQYLAELLSSCPDLQELTLYRGLYNQVLEISAPNLCRLTIIDGDWCSQYVPYKVEITCPRLEYLRLSSRIYLQRFHGQMPSLHDASIDLTYLEPHDPVQFSQIFESLRTVTKLTLDLKLGIKVEAWIEVKIDPRSLLKHMTHFPILDKLKRLEFSADIREDYMKQILLRFLMHSPNLSSLHVIHEPQEYSQLTSEACKQQCAIPTSSITLDHLKIVSVKGISDEQERSEVLKMLSEHVNEWKREVCFSHRSYLKYTSVIGVNIFMRLYSLLMR